jgi:hypothetical protein
MHLILSKLKERSTYAGLLTLLAALGLTIDPETYHLAVTILISLVGLYELLRAEK